ncbi:MAG: prepilin peptidase [Candidatus Izemoplasmatales bacterium]|jgi:prepilin signal peptidase PulO-like enzyme (type II secretory pathway)|nr:prepilin peptidase [Candidatus Izemoplasmatales bacterium]
MNYVLIVFVFILGMLLASFFNVIAIRVPNKMTLLGRSKCPKCGHDLRLVDVLPLIGYVINLGKCHFCKEKISIKYIVIELIGGFFFFTVYYIYGFSIPFIVAILMFSVLLIESISDLEYLEVIDIVWIIGVVPLIVIRIIQGSTIEYFLSSGVLFFFLLILSVAGKKFFKKEVLGGGDIKLYLFIGLILPIINAFLSLFIASLIGFIYGIFQLKKHKNEIPLVPFISIGVIVAFFFGNSIINWYLSLLGM